jgi:hypothetical protein
MRFSTISLFGMTNSYDKVIPIQNTLRPCHWNDTGIVHLVKGRVYIYGEGAERVAGEVCRFYWPFLI